MHLGKALLQSGEQVEKIFKRQVGMQPANDMKFSDCFRISRGRCLPGFLQRHGIGAGRVLFASKGTQPTGGHAYVGGIDMPVDVEKCLVAVRLLSDEIRHPADG